MGYIRLDEQPGEVYHYTHRKNLDSILRDGRIRRMGDRECWFCASLEDTLTLMRATVMMEGKPYYKVGGSIGRYPKFVPEDYVILRLNPRFQKGEWVQWMQEPHSMQSMTCSSCAYGCPAGIPLVQSFRTGKKLVRDAAAREKAKKEAAAK